MINIQDEKNQLLITCLWLNLVICIIDHFKLVKKNPLFSPKWFLCSLLIFTRVPSVQPPSLSTSFTLVTLFNCHLILCSHSKLLQAPPSIVGLDGLPATLECDRVRRRRKYSHSSKADLDPRPPHV